MYSDYHILSWSLTNTLDKDCCIPDALSRTPVWDPSRDDQEAEDEVEHHVHVVTINSSRMVHEDDQEDQQEHLCDPILNRLRTVALYDKNYKALIDIQNGFTFLRDKANASVTPFRKIRNELSVDDGIVLYGPRIIVAKSA